MKLTPEGEVKKAIKQILIANDVYYKFLTTGGYGASGFFDIVCMYKGVAFGIEVKSDATKKPTALQSLNARLFYEHGGTSMLLHQDNLHLLIRFLRYVDAGNREAWLVWPKDET